MSHTIFQKYNQVTVSDNFVSLFTSEVFNGKLVF